MADMKDSIQQQNDWPLDVNRFAWTSHLHLHMHPHQRPGDQAMNTSKLRLVTADSDRVSRNGEGVVRTNGRTGKPTLSPFGRSSGHGVLTALLPRRRINQRQQLPCGLPPTRSHPEDAE
jgi:hypothetical protein